MKAITLLIIFLLSAASAGAVDYYFSDRINFPPGESRLHNQTITANSSITITVPSGFTFIASNLSYSQSGSNYTWTISANTTFHYALQSPGSCTEDTIYASEIYENSALADEFIYVCVPDNKIVDYKVEYGHGCGNYIDDLYISDEPAALFNLVRVWNIGHFLSPDEDAQDAVISCNYPDFTVRTYGRAEVDYQPSYVNATFNWDYITGGYWFRIGVISQEVRGMSVGQNYSVNCSEITYRFEHGQVIAGFPNYSIEIRDDEPFSFTMRNISGSATTSEVTINNTEKYSVFNIFFDRTLDGFQQTERLLQLDPGESVKYEIDKNSTYNFTVHFIPPWQKNCWSDYYYSQSFAYSEAIVDTQAPVVTLASPSNGAQITNTYNVQLSVSATDNINIANCTVYTNISGSWQANTTINFTGTSDSDTWTMYNTPNGTFLWNAICYDSAGFSAWHASNYTFTVNVTGSDSLPPKVKLIAPDNGTLITAADDVALYLSAEDDIELASCTLYTNISGSWQANETKTFSGQFDADVWNLYNLSNGTYMWNALCLDAASNSAWNSTNYTFTVEYSPETTTEYITQTVSGGGGGGGSRTEYIYVDVPVEVPTDPEDRIGLQIISFPEVISPTDREFNVEAVVVNMGENTVRNIVVEPELPEGFSAEDIVIPSLGGGKAARVNFTITLPPICREEKLDELPMIGTLKHYISWDEVFSVRLIASTENLTAYDTTRIQAVIPDFEVTTDSYDYYEGDIMTICIIVNNIGKDERGKVEFELELYDKEKAYLADYLTPHSVDEDSIFVLKKSYMLNYIPVTRIYPLNATMYEEGALFAETYATGKDTEHVLLRKGPEKEFPLPIPLNISKWIARLALFLLLAAYISMPAPSAGGAGSAGAGAAGASKAAGALTIAGLCRKKVCVKKEKGVCRKFICKIPGRCKTKKGR